MNGFRFKRPHLSGVAAYRKRRLARRVLWLLFGIVLPLSIGIVWKYTHASLRRDVPVPAARPIPVPSPVGQSTPLLERNPIRDEIINQILADGTPAEQTVTELFTLQPNGDSLSDSSRPPKEIVSVWYREMVKAGASEQAFEAAEAIKGEFARVSALIELSRVLSQEKRQEAAEQVANRALAWTEAIEEPAHKTFFLAQITLALTEANQHDKATKLAGRVLERVEKTGMVWEQQGNQYEVALILAEAGRKKEAVAIAGKMPDHFSGAPQVHHVALNLAKAGKMEEAQETVQILKDAYERACAWSEIAEALSGTDYKEEARDSARRAFLDAIHRPHALDRYGFLPRLCLTLVKTNQTEDALILAQTIEDMPTRADALSQIALMLAKAERNSEVLRVSNLALEATKNIKEVPARAQALSLVAQVLAEVDTSKSRQLARQAVELVPKIKNDIDNLGAFEWTLSQVACAVAKSDQDDEANQILKRAIQLAQQEKGTDRPYALYHIVRAMIEAGRLREANVTAQKIQNVTDREAILGEIALAWVKADKLDEALTVVQQIKSSYGKSSPLGDITLALAQAGKKGKAEQIAKEAVRAAKSTRYIRSELLAQVATAYALCGDYRLARETCKECEAADRLRANTEILRHYNQHRLIAQAHAEVAPEKR